MRVGIQWLGPRNVRGLDCLVPLVKSGFLINIIIVDYNLDTNLDLLPHQYGVPNFHNRLNPLLDFGVAHREHLEDGCSIE